MTAKISSDICIPLQIVAVDVRHRFRKFRLFLMDFTHLLALAQLWRCTREGGTVNRRSTRNNVGHKRGLVIYRPR